MKNFKKVISAVIALAMSVSSFAAVSAAKFTDVADTAAYAEAVDVLSALGIVTGYEDGTFQPEGAITRAETATMIVGALNMTEDAKASAGSSQFDDVNTQAAWAQGYVNVGVAQGFIKGMDAKTFAPQENVTYAQMCVMLTSIAGFGDYAAANPNNKEDWSYGYTAMAAATGINKGVSVAKDTNLTRGQVAQMIYNTLLTPMLGVAEYNLTGNSYSQLDGKNGRDFKTLLSDKFNGYVVTATIMDTPAAGSIANDEVEINITKADWFEDYTTATAAGAAWTGLLYNFADDVDVNSNLFQNGKAVLVKDEDQKRDYTMIYFSANSRTETKEFDAADYSLQSDLSSGNRFETSNKIKLGNKYYTVNTVSSTPTLNLYVNGALTDTLTCVAGNNNTLDKYLGKAVGTIKIMKDATDNGYSSVFVDCYEIAEVTGVTYKNGKTTVQFVQKTDYASPFRKIEIDDDKVEDGDVILSVQKGDAETALKNLAKDDVIAIRADFSEVSTGGTLANPKNLTVLATNDTITGKVTGKDDEEKVWSIDGKTYAATVYNAGDFNLKDSYTFRLDPLGRIFDADEEASSKNYAILDKYNTSSEKVKLILADGTSKEYEIGGNLTILDVYKKIYTIVEDTTTPSNASGFNDANSNGKLDANEVASCTTKKAPNDRVVEYTIKTSTGELTALTVATATAQTNKEYKERTGKLGSASINESTKILDISDYVTSDKANDVTTVSELKDGVEYSGYSIKSSSSTYASLVILTSIGKKFTEDSRFAVVRKAPQTDIYNDEDCYRVNVLYGGEEVDLYLSETFTIATTGVTELTYGDAFYFETDSDGFIDTVYVVYDFNSTAKTGTFKNFTAAGIPSTAYDSSSTGWRFNLYDDGHDYALVYGIITEVKGNTVFFSPAKAALLDQTKIDTNVDITSANNAGVADFVLASDAQVYTYDVDLEDTKEYDKIGLGNVIASNLSAWETSTSGVFTINTDSERALNYAVAMIVDGSIVEILEFVK